MPTLFPSTPEPSTTLLSHLASRALGSLPSRILHHLLLPSLPRCRRHGRFACYLLLLSHEGQWGGPTAVVVVAAVHAAGERHTEHDGAQRPPGEANLRVAVLLPT